MRDSLKETLVDKAGSGVIRNFGGSDVRLNTVPGKEVIDSDRKKAGKALGEMDKRIHVGGMDAYSGVEYIGNESRGKDERVNFDESKFRNLPDISQPRKDTPQSMSLDKIKTKDFVYV